DPWLFDLEKDPDEMINLFNDPKSKKIVITMTTQLQSYSKLQKDPYADLPQIKSAMDEVFGK
ncbi:MAG: sulfatase yidj, partial [Verrucomicrobiota bacterium]|nr:sulfatase yidj [Verrucomicrobiota bacterium]